MPRKKGFGETLPGMASRKPHPRFAQLPQSSACLWPRGQGHRGSFEGLHPTPHHILSWQKGTGMVEFMPGPSGGCVCVRACACVGGCELSSLPTSYLTGHVSVCHMTVFLFMVHGQGDVCHPGSHGGESIFQNVPSPKEACQGMPSVNPRRKVLVNLIGNQAKFFPPSTSGMSPGNSGCLPQLHWGSTGVRKEARMDAARTRAQLTVGLGNSNHMVLWRPCHARRAWVLFLSNKISDYSQVESDMACLVTLNILLRDSLTQNP